MEMVGFALEALLAAICFAAVFLIGALVIAVVKWIVEFISK